MEKNRVKVVIDGEIITLVSDENEAYMQQLALYINKKLSEIRSSKSDKPLSEHLRTLLISVNIADDYFKSVAKRQLLEDTHEAFKHETSHTKEENAALAEKLLALQAQLDTVREQHSRDLAQLEALQKENAQLAERTHGLQENLQYARSELEEYISTFDNTDDRKNVVSFSSGVGR
ncbi:MAG: cell division protein ZapA [Defluviitaleaceae bacterium]|nr:cell division protein ZapA [Defluviitaleaceae bacterium]